MRRVIVNADDLGRTAGINQGIFQAHLYGIVSSATVMVCYPMAEQAAEMAREHPRLGLGLHAQLSGGRPLSPPDRVRSLIDEQGRFPAKPEGHRSPTTTEAAREVRAQFERFVKLFGRKPTHLDSHHHSHRRPEIFEAVVALASEERLPVRNAGQGMGARLKSAKVRTTEHFVEEFFDRQATIEDLEHIVASLGEGTTELMCHPAVVDEELRRSSSYAEPRTLELQVLTDPRARRALQSSGVTLVHFGGL